jgi:protein tyrosine/serine phosphatase
MRAICIAQKRRSAVHTKSFWNAILTVAVLAITSSLADAGERGVPGIAGVWNFAKVNDRLYRGAEPSAAGIVHLKELGAKSIIDLRLASEVRNQEQKAALGNGLVYTNVPLRGLGAPTAEQVKLVLGLIDTLPSPVFIHCQHGCDRTGTIIACYRIAHDQWTSRSALDEAKLYGLSYFEPGMKTYVAEFAKTSKKPILAREGPVRLSEK